MKRLTKLFLVLLICTGSADGAPDAAHVQGKTVFISQPLQGNSTTLAAALQDQAVTDIILLSNYTVGVQGELQQRMGTFIPISRNLTIQGSHGTEDVLDLQFKLGVVELCATCTVSFKNITVANERRGNGNAWDFFVGPPGPGVVHAGVFMQDMIRLRYACTAAVDAGQVTAAAPRTSWLPMSSSGKQEFKIVDVAFQDTEYPDMLVALDYAADLDRTVQEGRGAYGGYATWGKNVSRLCRYTVDKACLSKKSPDACVNDLIDQVIAGTLGAASSSNNSILAVAIAVPVCVVAVLVIATAFLLLRRKRRQKQLAQQKQQLDQQQLEQLKAREPRNTPPGKSVPGSDIETGPCSSDSTSLVRAPLGGGQGWEQLLCLTSPILGSLDNEDVHFGKLLGQGSFGRVYRARWAGREVAVKVIEHDSDAQATIENEVLLMLNFNHPNIVRAFHGATYVHKGTINSSGGARSTSLSSMLRSAQSGAGTSGPHDLASSQLMHERISSANAEQTSSDQSHVHHTQGTSLPGSQSTAFAAAAVATSAGVGTAGPAAAAEEAVAAMSSQQASSNSGTNVVRCQEDSASGVHQQQLDQQHAARSTETSNAAAQDAAPRGSVSRGSTTPTSSVTPSFERKGQPIANKHSRCETWLVQEYCDCGTLSSIAAEWIPEEECDEQMLERLLLLQDAAQGLKVLHSKNVVHGDLNSRNVLVSSSPVTQFGVVAKLADLGLSRTIKQHQTHRTTQTVGTMSHMPPELLRHGRMSPAVDVYSLGVMMWELYTGQVAFRKLHYGQFFDAIVLRNLRPLVPVGMPSDYQLLMERCWATDPADRPSIDRVLECLQIMVQERRRRLSLDCPCLTAEHCASQPFPSLQQQASQGDSRQLPPWEMHSCPTAELQSQSGDLSQNTGSAGEHESALNGARRSLVHSFDEPPAAAPAQSSGPIGGQHMLLAPAAPAGGGSCAATATGT